MEWKKARPVRIEHPTSEDAGRNHRNTREKEKRTGSRNITPGVALRHRRNILLPVDVTPRIGVIDVVIVSTWGGRMSVVPSDRQGVDTCSGSTSATRAMEGSLKGGSGKPIHKWRWYWTG